MRGGPAVVACRRCRVGGMDRGPQQKLWSLGITRLDLLFSTLGLVSCMHCNAYDVGKRIFV